MGFRWFSSSSKLDDPQQNQRIPCFDANPDPDNYQIVRHEQIGDYLLVKILYPNCTNYEGNKILVFKGIDINALRKQRQIDPHFSDKGIYHHPIARFIPTDEGWRMARKLAQ